jgi:hypothetical protein
MVKNGRLLILSLAVAACGLIAFTGTAQAGTVNSLMNRNDSNSASDNNAEYLIVDQDSDGRLDPGDVIVGAIDINTLNSTSANLGGFTPNDQWSGVFALQVRDIINFNSSTGTGDILFQPWSGFSGFLATLNAGSGPSDNPTVPTGTIVRLWTNSSATSNFVSGGSYLASISTAASGSYFWDLGFADPTSASHVDSGSIVSDNGEGWVARNGGIEIAGLVTQSTQDTFGTGNFALSLLGRGAGLGLGETPLSSGLAGLLGATFGDTAHVTGSSTIRGSKGAEANGGFHAGSDTNFGFVALPLPGAALSGIAMLLGLGFIQHRRRKLS